jgi:hypothetical protein
MRAAMMVALLGLLAAACASSGAEILSSSADEGGRYRAFLYVPASACLSITNFLRRSSSIRSAHGSFPFACRSLLCEEERTSAPEEADGHESQQGRHHRRPHHTHGSSPLAHGVHRSDNDDDDDDEEHRESKLVLCDTRDAVRDVCFSDTGGSRGVISLREIITESQHSLVDTRELG